jgi:hypothetical protein
MLRSCWKAKEGKRKKEEGRRKKNHSTFFNYPFPIPNSQLPVTDYEEGRSSVKDLTDERTKKNYSTFFNYQFPIPHPQCPMPNARLPSTNLK